MTSFCRKNPNHHFPWLLAVVLVLFQEVRTSNAWISSTTPTTTRYTTTSTKTTSWLPKSRVVQKPYFATLAPPPEETTYKVSNDQKDLVLQTIESVTAQEGKEYANDFDFTITESAIYALFAAIRKSNIPLGLKGQPFVLRRDEILQAMSKVLTDDKEAPFDHFFTLQDLAKAVEEDFLDAARGSTDNRKGWKITNVSTPRGESFEEARMTFDEVQEALERGTVILNAIGAHVPKLAAPSLACTDATALPNAINLYVTAAGKRTSAPPHTDRQDVVVVQTSGSKRWKVFAPTDPARKPMSDMFARGKGDDNLPLHQLLNKEQDPTNPNASELLVETTLNMGDVLFIPAAFPHTTSTANNDVDETSVHLTFNIDSHIWELDYLSARKLALRRGGVLDSALGQNKDTENRYEGKVNELPTSIQQDIMDMLPVGLLEDDTDLAKATSELKRIAMQVDETTASAVEESVWEETMIRLRQQGMELFETHRDMYLAAIQEGRTREAEDAMTAHLTGAEDDGGQSQRKTMSPERMQRLSLFRVKKYYEAIDESKNTLLEWSRCGTAMAAAAADSNDGGSAATTSAPALPADWAFTLPIKVGDQVEADLGGAFFDATVTRVAPGNKYDVQFFDGDREVGLDRAMLKLKTPPALESDDDDVDTSNMTPKQLKRWRKQQEKKNKKKN